MTAIITNLHLKGFSTGKIYTGKMKKICVPGLNCYSCPGALGSCPIGSLQAVIGGIKYQFSFYMIGLLMLIGSLVGRFVCGWLCPFGLIQELIHKIPLPKLKVNKTFNKLKYLKYLILVIFVFLLPMFWVNIVGMGKPTFCEFICPAGTLEGGIPLVLLNKPLRAVIGFLYTWKIALLVITVILSIFIFRPFCRFICPLGAIYSLFNPISLYRLKIDSDKCTSCGICSRKCKMQVDVYKNPNSLECIRCGECISSCPQNAIEIVKPKLPLVKNSKNNLREVK
ncbi:4Fe-4S binding protein [Vallitalea guaymasensis]|uniref:4Fe-4S binding protein n=1 Tax=Vallitalea guaymasensis TaxID=1185412 RepID=A0A8J8SEG4_9FIRM|nr:4Fe-4S binding protein [Vallitalea guaymasensis]QUH31913.1 4Fe-4S binding protein [Vallitalea guaymasensis]